MDALNRSMQFDLMQTAFFWERISNDIAQQEGLNYTRHLGKLIAKRVLWKDTINVHSPWLPRSKWIWRCICCCSMPWTSTRRDICSGYSPKQWFMGRNLVDEILGGLSLERTVSEQFSGHVKRVLGAGKAFLVMDARAMVRGAFRARNRTAVEFQARQLV